MGRWYNGLTAGRREATPAMKQKVADLTAHSRTQLEKMKAIATFMQVEVRYVAITLGIGGQQPHPANEIFDKRFGDCKDKATLMSTMLKEIGVDSYYVIINTERGSVSEKTPAAVGDFNHVVLAIRLPKAWTTRACWLPSSIRGWGGCCFLIPPTRLLPLDELAATCRGITACW